MNRFPLMSLLRQRARLTRQNVNQFLHKTQDHLRFRKVDLGRWLSMDLGELGRRLMAELKEKPMPKRWTGMKEMRAGDWPDALRWVILTVAFVTVLGIAALLLWSTPWQQLTQQTQEIELLKARYLQVALQSGMKPRYEQQLEQIEAQFGEMLEMIPASLETVQVLDQVSRAAQTSGLRLQGFKPAAEVQEDAYVILPVDIRLTGNYHAVGRFLEAVSRMKHLITVDVRLEAMDSAPGQLALATRIRAYRGDMARKRHATQPTALDAETVNAPR